MSLRDQLMATGLVSKKRARKLDQQDKAERKRAKGNKKRKKELEREARQAAEAKAREEQEARRQARAEYLRQRERMERALQVRNIILGHRIRGSGPVRFFHKELEGKKVLRMDLSAQLADRLRRGDAAIVALPTGRDVSYQVVGRKAAERLHELAPHLLVAWARGASDDPADQLLAESLGVPSLRTRRATEADVRRLRTGM